MGNNKRAYSHRGQIQDKYPNNRKTYANKRIKTTKSDLIINKRSKNEANGQPVCTIDANVQCNK